MVNLFDFLGLYVNALLEFLIALISSILICYQTNITLPGYTIKLCFLEKAFVSLAVTGVFLLTYIFANLRVVLKPTWYK
jgi:hypothetical protein